MVIQPTMMGPRIEMRSLIQAVIRVVAKPTA